MITWLCLAGVESGWKLVDVQCTDSRSLFQQVWPGARAWTSTTTQLKFCNRRLDIHKWSLFWWIHDDRHSWGHDLSTNKYEGPPLTLDGGKYCLYLTSLRLYESMHVVTLSGTKWWRTFPNFNSNLYSFLKYTEFCLSDFKITHFFSTLL